MKEDYILKKQNQLLMKTWMPITIVLILNVRIILLIL